MRDLLIGAALPLTALLLCPAPGWQARAADEPARIVAVRTRAYEKFDRFVLELDRSARVARPPAVSGRLEVRISARPGVERQIVGGALEILRTADGARVSAQSGPMLIRVFTLEGPPRVVIDLGDPSLRAFVAPNDGTPIFAGSALAAGEPLPAPDMAAAPKPEPEPEPEPEATPAPLPSPEQKTTPRPFPAPIAPDAEAELGAPPHQEPAPIAEAPQQPETEVAAEPAPGEQPEPVVTEAPAEQSEPAVTEAPAEQPEPVVTEAPAEQSEPAVTEPPAPVTPSVGRESYPASGGDGDGIPALWIVVAGTLLLIALLAWPALRLRARMRRRVALEAGPALDSNSPETISPEELLPPADRVELLERRLDEEVRARITLQEKLGQMTEQYKVLRARLARLARQRGDAA